MYCVYSLHYQTNYSTEKEMMKDRVLRHGLFLFGVYFPYAGDGNLCYLKNFEKIDWRRRVR